MPLDDYRDVDFGWLDDVIDHFSFKYYAYIKQERITDIDGTDRWRYRRIIVEGSLQVFNKQINYNNEGINSSVRKGKFYTKYQYKLSEGDMIQKKNEYFLIKDSSDYDYMGVRNYEVERIDNAETFLYNFIDGIEEKFSDMEKEGEEDDN